MAELAKSIRVEREGNHERLLINGEEFPWFIGTHISTEVDKGDLPSVTITIVADEVSILDSITGGE